MSATHFNPVQFGNQVIDQFGRYLMTSYPVADPRLEEQVRQRVRHGLGGERLIAKGPYVYLNRPFESGPRLEDLAAEEGLGIHPALPGLFPFQELHKHQELTFRTALAGRHAVVATGTGSGKTEAFLLPVLDHALKLRDQGAPEGVSTLIIYPMNALADDQLQRLRRLLAGSGITYGRYTGVTPNEGEPQLRMEQRRRYSREEVELLDQGRDEDVPLPWEECYSRQEIRARRPRILLTNYFQLEYLLLRDKDLDLLRDAPLRFLVLDEIHTYTGALGSEVACLVRRLRRVARKSPSEVICLGTSATVRDRTAPVDTEQITRSFAARLFGVAPQQVDLVTEHYKDLSPDQDAYSPQPPSDARGLLERLLEAVEPLQRREEVEELPESVLQLVEELCGRPAEQQGALMQRAFQLLASNRIVLALGGVFSSPQLIEAAFPRLRELGREQVGDEDLVAEMLGYLVLGALVQRDGEPVLRPKLHYFVQGYQGLSLAFDSAGLPRIEFAGEQAQSADSLSFPLVLCRSCGQHYAALFALEESLPPEGPGLVRTTRGAAPAESQGVLYVTDRLVGLDETTEDQVEAQKLCRYCGTLHPLQVVGCLNPRCRRQDGLLEVRLGEGPMKRCLACGTDAKGYEEIVTPARSSEVADVTILAQSMLSNMPDPSQRKLLVFADNRQEAAFQAGWMEERSRRFRLRHLLASLLEERRENLWTIEELTQSLLDEAQRQGIYRASHWSDKDNLVRLRWFLLEEFMSTGQRRNSLESLAMAEVLTAKLGAEDAPDFYRQWVRRLGLSSAHLEGLLRLFADLLRRRGLVAHTLLSRQWSYSDYEVRKGLIRVYERYRPLALVRRSARQSSYTRTWMARRGYSAIQALTAQALPEVASDVRNLFLEEVWDWWRSEGILKPVTLTFKVAGRHQAIDLGGQGYQLDEELFAVRWTDRHWVCNACRRSQNSSTPSGICPEYRCSGLLEKAGRPLDHFDVVQYTQGRFVPLKAREHTAQVPKAEREQIEREFKRREGGEFNCLVCTPTLELGVDIGKLEIVLMRNVPPTPANYAQRAGRAGRRHRIAVVVTYCGGSHHDRYFFEHPRGMIAGEVRVPAFSMRNEPLIRKHLHSAVLSELRDRGGADVRETLRQVFPPYISEYFTRWEETDDKPRAKVLPQPRDVSALADLLAEGRSGLLESLDETFFQTWPKEDREEVSPQVLGQLLDVMTSDLQRHVRGLFDQVAAYQSEIQRLVRIQLEGGQLREEEEKQRRRYDHAIRHLRERNQENYTLSYLSRDGFFPGYALARQSIRASCPSPLIELSRPAAVALRELTPANFVYANRNVFRVRKLALYTVRAEDARQRSHMLHQPMEYFARSGRVGEPASRSVEGGGDAPLPFRSFQLTDVEMLPQQDIDDQEAFRRRIGFLIFGLPRHRGGSWGRVGGLEIRYLRQQTLRLVNLGESQDDPRRPFSLFPLCPLCGEARSTRASESEMASFQENHEKFHGEPTVDRFALHIDLSSDALHLGPLRRPEDAASLFEGLRIGARMVLDMGTTELEGFIHADESGDYRVAIYDPMPGGSGFLPQLIEFWPWIVERAIHALQECPGQCRTACYACLKHFSNQQHHEKLNRHRAVELLKSVQQEVRLQHEIAPSAVDHTRHSEDADSQAEEDFLEICRRRGFPRPPAAQFRVDLDGDSTVADYAWPDRKVLLYIDGLSET
ncbi:MAG: DEAD/DEAH box helicase, partial [Acidobacteriota bacterium]